MPVSQLGHHVVDLLLRANLFSFEQLHDLRYFADRPEMIGAAEGRPIITVEFVDPAEQLPHPEREVPVPEKPRSIAACGSVALTS